MALYKHPIQLNPTMRAGVGASLEPRGGGDHPGLLLQQRHVVAEEHDPLAKHQHVPHVPDQHHGDEGLPAPRPQVALLAHDEQYKSLAPELPEWLQSLFFQEPSG